MTLCALACFVEFYVLVFNKIDVGGPKIVQNNIRVGNFWEKVPNDHSRILEEGPMLVTKTAQGSPTYGGN